MGPLGEVPGGRDWLWPFSDRLRTGHRQLRSSAQRAPLGGFHVRRELRFRREAHAARKRGGECADCTVDPLSHLSVDHSEPSQHSARARAAGAHGEHWYCRFADYQRRKLGTPHCCALRSERSLQPACVSRDGHKRPTQWLLRRVDKWSANKPANGTTC